MPFVGMIDYWVFQNFPIGMLFCCLFLQDYLIAHSLFWITKEKAFLHDGERHGFNSANLLRTTSMNTVTLYCSSLLTQPYSSLGTELLLFIPYSFIFEIVFDFFHYSIHRTIHTLPWFYRHIHKYHHQQTRISVFTAFHQDVIDLFLTNTIPVLLTVSLCRPSTLFIFVWFLYKSLEEIYGHLGKVSSASSFPQCIWLPRLAGFELYAKDHERHHRNPNVNFSKRFSLWDKVFGTYA